MIGACLNHAGLPAAVIGTLGWSVCRPDAGPSGASPLSSAVSDRTTPESSDLFRLLRRAVDLGARSTAVEVSSHALDQGRLNGMAFDAAVFTNLSRDHLDYHPSMEAYYEAKRRLFTLLRSGGRAVINVDDEYGRRLAAEVGSAAEVWRCSAAGRSDAEVRVVRSELDLAGIRAEFETPGGPLSLTGRLLGRFNLENLTAAVAAASALGVPADAIRAALAAEEPLDGRLAPVDRGQEFPVLVDYAHTDDGLRAAIGAIRELCSRRIAVVFGCGGDRDRGKRELMGRAVGELADLAIVTDDNPRSEDPARIHRAIVAGLRAAGGCGHERRPGPAGGDPPRGRGACRRRTGVGGADRGEGSRGDADGRGSEVALPRPGRGRTVPSSALSASGSPNGRKASSRVRRHLTDAADVMSGALVGDVEPGACYRGAAIDSRRVEGGELFFARCPASGPTATGSWPRPSPRAPRRRSSRRRWAKPAAPRSAVGDVTAALHDLTRDHRRRLDIRVAAVTGSAGKTTTKDLLALLLGERWRVRKSPRQPEQPPRFPAHAAGDRRGLRVAGRRDGDVDPRRTGGGEPPGAAGRGRVHERTAGAPGRLRATRRRGRGRRGHRPGEGGTAGGPRRGRP